MTRKFTLSLAACLSLAAAQWTSAQVVTITELSTTPSACDLNGNVIFTASAFTISGFNVVPCPGATLRIEGGFNSYNSGNVSLQGNATYLYGATVPLYAGNYTAFVEGCGITATQAFTITNCGGLFNLSCTQPITYTSAVYGVDLCNNGGGTVSTSGTGGVNNISNPNGEITWYLNGGQPRTVAQGANATWSGLTAGTYGLTATTADCPTQAVPLGGFVLVDPGPPSIAASTSQVNSIGGPTGSINLTVTGGTPPYTYAWSNASTIEDPINLFPGTYTVTVTDANGCTTTASATLLNAVGIEENELENAISFFPNPTNGLLNVEIEGALLGSNTLIQVSDVLGRVVSTQRAISGLQQIDLSGDPEGIYVVQVRDGVRVTTRRITLQ